MTFTASVRSSLVGSAARPPVACAPRRARTKRARRAGVAAIEFAMVLPLFLAVLALTVDLGRLGFDRNVVANAARLGASVASHEPPGGSDQTAWQAKIREHVENELSQLGGFDPEDVELSVSLVDEGGLPCACVELEYPFRMLFDWPVLGSQTSIKQIVVSPLETDAP
jgi:hypothetical protein